MTAAAIECPQCEGTGKQAGWRGAAPEECDLCGGDGEISSTDIPTPPPETEG